MGLGSFVADYKAGNVSDGRSAFTSEFEEKARERRFWDWGLEPACDDGFHRIHSLSTLITRCIDEAHQGRFYKAVKSGDVMARQSVPGNCLNTYSQNGIVESSVVEKPNYIVLTKLDAKGNVLLDEHGHENSWQVTEDAFRSRYMVPDGPIDFSRTFSPTYKEQLFVKVPHDIAIEVPWGPNGEMVIEKIEAGGRLNITDANNVYGISSRDFNDTYRIIQEYEPTESMAIAIKDISCDFDMYEPPSGRVERCIEDNARHYLDMGLDSHGYKLSSTHHDTSDSFKRYYEVLNMSEFLHSAVDNGGSRGVVIATRSGNVGGRVSEPSNVLSEPRMLIRCPENVCFNGLESPGGQTVELRVSKGDWLDITDMPAITSWSPDEFDGVDAGSRVFTRPEYIKDRSGRQELHNAIDSVTFKFEDFNGRSPQYCEEKLSMLESAYGATAATVGLAQAAKGAATVMSDTLGKSTAELEVPDWYYEGGVPVVSQEAGMEL